MELVVVSLILAIVAAVFEFGGIASAITSIALILFWIFLVVFAFGLLFRLASGHGGMVIMTKSLLTISPSPRSPLQLCRVHLKTHEKVPAEGRSSLTISTLKLG